LVSFVFRHVALRLPRCLALFITHYPQLTAAVHDINAAAAAAAASDAATPVAANYHMAFLESSDTNEGGTFLYQLVPGPASRSYGLHVAAMARLPQEVLAVARRRAAEMRRGIAS
jgi:DNA mismatch repair ATPase MutS